MPSPWLMRELRTYMAEDPAYAERITEQTRTILARAKAKCEAKPKEEE